MSFGSEFVFTLFTNDHDLAVRAEQAGINRIGLDLEVIDKHLRQDRKKCWISDHELHQAQDLRNTLNHAKFFTRTNPIHAHSREEIDTLIDAGVEVLMLPMFRTLKEASTFLDLVQGRATTVLLVETAAAAMRTHELVKLDGLNEIHIGLNDIHIDMKLRNHFEVLTSGLLDMLADTVLTAGLPFGFGGLGRLDDSRLPIASELIYPQYARLGATRALVSRVYTSPDYHEIDLCAEMKKSRNMLDYWSQQSKDTLDEEWQRLRRKVHDWNA